jgi:hypothetical protein
LLEKSWKDNAILYDISYTALFFYNVVFPLWPFTGIYNEVIKYGGDECAKHLFTWKPWIFCIAKHTQGWGRLQSLITITILITGHRKLLITITIMIIWRFLFWLQLRFQLHTHDFFDYDYNYDYLSLDRSITILITSFWLQLRLRLQK